MSVGRPVTGPRAAVLDDRCAVAGPRERRRHVEPPSPSTVVTRDRICDLGGGWAGAGPVWALAPADPI